MKSLGKILKAIRDRSWKFWTQLFVLVAAFLFSVQLRSFNYDQPIGRHHEWITAHTLVTMKTWAQRGGPEHFHFSPLYTYQGKFDKHHALLGGVEDKQGDMYYVSYPPFAYLLPYYSLKLVGAPFTPASIQIFGYVIHFITALLFFLLIVQMSGKNLSDEFCYTGIIAFLLYVFAPGNLWFHSNVYFVDVLMQTLFLAQLYVYHRIFRNGDKHSRKLKIALFGVTFFAIYTEWLGVFLAFSFFLFAGVRWLIRRNKAWFRIALIVSLATVCSLGTTFLQYSSIAGTDKFIEASVNKFKMRSGHGGEEKSEYGFGITNPESYRMIDQHISRNYLPLENLVGIFFLLFIAVVLFRRKYFFNHSQLFVLALVLFSVFLHLLVFFNFNAVHDFGTMKTGLLMMVVIVFSLMQVEKIISDLVPKFYPLVVSLIFLLVGMKLVQSYDLYVKENGLDKVRMNNLNIGSAVQQFADSSEQVFVDVWPSPEIMFYAERNPIPQDELSNAIKFLKDFNIEKGIYIRTKGSDQVLDVFRINVNGDSLRVGP